MNSLQANTPISARCCLNCEALPPPCSEICYFLVAWLVGSKGGTAWWERAAYIMVVRKQKARQELGTRIYPSRLCPQWPTSSNQAPLLTAHSDYWTHYWVSLLMHVMSHDPITFQKLYLWAHEAFGWIFWIQNIRGAFVSKAHSDCSWLFAAKLSKSWLFLFCFALARLALCCWAITPALRASCSITGKHAWVRDISWFFPPQKMMSPLLLETVALFSLPKNDCQKGTAYWHAVNICWLRGRQKIVLIFLGILKHIFFV